MKLSGFIAYLRMMSMLKALSVRIERIGLHLLMSKARVIAASSARLIVSRSGCDLILMYVIVCMIGFNIVVPSIGLPVMWDPFM
jgi:hypothetical protein